LSLDAAKEKVKAELDAKETKKEALKTYVTYKKGQAEGVEIQTLTISPTKNPFGIDAFEVISKLTLTSPFSKPIMVGEDYFTFELVKINQPKAKSYEEAKNDVIYLYIDEQKKAKLLELAKNSFATFNGTTTDFITGNDYNAITDLSGEEAKEFLSMLFTTQNKRGFFTLESGNVVMYNVLEQKLLNNTNTDQNNQVVRLKSTMFSEGLIKNLQNKYKTEIFIQGL
jgi:peptidyl-prolyl cis-trans isomerase D